MTRRPIGEGFEQNVPDGEDIVLSGARKPVDERVHAREAGPRGDGSCCDDHGVRRELADELGRRLGAEPNVYSVPVELPFEVACDPAELVAAGRPQNQVYLAPELVLALDECHPVAALRKDGGGLHPCRPAAGDEPARRLIGRGDRSRAESPLAPGTRIDGARDRQPLEDATDAALVAADAVNELALAALAYLVRELGVGDLRAGHCDHVRLAACEDLLGHCRILDAADGEHRQLRQGGFHLRGEVDEIAVGDIRGLDRLEDVVVPGRCDVHVVDPPVGLEQPDSPDRVLDVERARDEVGQADPDANDPVVAGTRPHLLDHLAREAEPVLERPAVLVLALVVERRQELMQEVAVGDVHLRAVKASPRA